jgi:hypothetical protein
VVHIILIHGVGGARSASDWIGPLNLRLDGMGYPTIAEPHETIIAPSYEGLFAAREEKCPPDTYAKPTDRVVFEQRLEYAARQKALERIVRPHADAADVWGVGDIPPVVINPLADLAEYFHFEDVRTYIDTAAVRNAVWQKVLADIPKSGRAVIIGHSLGSVVAAGLLRRLPANLTVELFVTVASPLSYPRYRQHLGSLWDGFPYGRVLRWINVYSPWDGITGGRGISQDVDDAIDVCAHVDGAHSLEAYMSHPALVAAVAAAIFPTPDDSKPGADIPARRIHPSWYPLLLGTAFTKQLAKSLPSDDWRKYLRLEAARREVATRAVADIADKRAERSAFIQQLHDLGVTPDAQRVHDHPLADGRYPTFQDLISGAAALLAGEWTDEQLLPLAVGLMLQPLVTPFDIQADNNRRRAALELTLNVVRGTRGNLADQTYAEQVRKSLEWAKDRLANGGKFPWGTVLIASGLAVLAATGVGLAVAAPAGLAGAAVVTSTLAAFGPGGMVGGLLTLSAMTGTAGILGTLGVSMTLQDSAGGAKTTTLTEQTGAELASLPPDTLAVTLTGMLAVVHVQASLDFTSTAAFVREAVTIAQDRVVAEHQQHDEIAPDTDGTKQWAKKIKLLTRALNALDLLTEAPEVDQLITARKAIESGKRPAILPSPQPPALPGGAEQP